MLKKANRLNSTEFNTLFTSGKKSHSQSFMVITAGEGNPRVAVTVSKKKAKSAVQRVRIRRQVYEYMRKNYLQNMKGQYIVVVKHKEFDLRELDTLLK